MSSCIGLQAYYYSPHIWDYLTSTLHARELNFQEMLWILAVLIVKDDDFGFEDDVLGVAIIPFDGAQFIDKPRHLQHISLQLLPADALGNVKNKVYI